MLAGCPQNDNFAALCIFKWQGSQDSWKPQRASFCVVEDDAERVARAAMDAAYPMLHVDAVKAASAADGTVARCENNCLALIGVDHFGFGLRSWLLFD